MKEEKSISQGQVEWLVIEMSHFVEEKRNSQDQRRQN